MRKLGLIWDLDGTLIDSVEHHWEAWQRTMPKVGISFTYHQFVADFGKRNSTIIRAYLGEDLPLEECERIAVIKEQEYRDLVREKGIDFLPGAAAALERFRAAGFLQALGTSAPWGNIDAVLDVLPLGAKLEALVSSEEVANGKPFPDVFLKAAEKLGLPPEDCAVVEDAPAGIEAAKAAGMIAVGLLSTHQQLEGDVIVESLDGLSPTHIASMLSGSLGSGLKRKVK